MQPEIRPLRPADLAREHGLSTQAVRNYERDGCLPVAERSASGYRRYSAVHAEALRAFLALVRAHGHAAAGDIMRAVNRGDVDRALAMVDRGHAQLLRDRETLDAVAVAAVHLTGAGGSTDRHDPLSIGELAHRLGLVPATLRSWERAGVLRPGRDPASGHRRYGADDVRDAQLAHLLRRGGYRLDHIATVLDHVRGAGGADALRASLDGWRERLRTRGLAMLSAAGLLGRYLDRLRPETTTAEPVTVGPITT
jgi:DNA-binding transcriptional MerR regulator